MGMQEALTQLGAGRDVSPDEAAAAIRDAVNGSAGAAELERFAAGLRAPGETGEQLTAMAGVLRGSATPLQAPGPLLDTAGTGGDEKRSFNISTVAAIVTAAAGVRVAKLHDRAVSSRCGSTELLEAFGVAADLPPDAAARCLEETGLCFLAAPRYFAAAHQQVDAADRTSEARALIHLLGLLAHPAGAEHRLVGVADAHRAEAVAQALRLLGTKHALVVRGDDGMDEITPTGTTTIREVVGGQVKTWTLDPREFDVELAPRHAILGGPPDESKLITEFLLRGKSSPYADYAKLNAAAALFAADRVPSIKEGLALARETVGSGAAKSKLEQVVEVSQGLTARVG